MAKHRESRHLLSIGFQSLKGFQRFCGDIGDRGDFATVTVSIPKRVSEVLWQYLTLKLTPAIAMFQSLKGFQRFCGEAVTLGQIERDVSIPKRVSEVLWR